MLLLRLFVCNLVSQLCSPAPQRFPLLQECCPLWSLVCDPPVTRCTVLRQHSVLTSGRNAGGPRLAVSRDGNAAAFSSDGNAVAVSGVGSVAVSGSGFGSAILGPLQSPVLTSLFSGSDVNPSYYDYDADYGNYDYPDYDANPVPMHSVYHVMPQVRPVAGFNKFGSMISRFSPNTNDRFNNYGQNTNVDLYNYYGPTNMNKFFPYRNINRYVRNIPDSLNESPQNIQAQRRNSFPNGRSIKYDGHSKTLVDEGYSSTFNYKLNSTNDLNKANSTNTQFMATNSSDTNSNSRVNPKIARNLSQGDNFSSEDNKNSYSSNGKDESADGVSKDRKKEEISHGKKNSREEKPAV